MKLPCALGAAVVLLGSFAFAAEPGRPQPVLDASLYDGADGVRCRYFNAGAHIPWRRPGGDWIDRGGSLHGPEPYSRENIAAENRVRAIQLDVSDLVREFHKSPHRQVELMLREVSEHKGGTVHFRSRESAPDQGPRLVIEYADGQTVRVPASADAHISCSTFRGLGGADRLSIGRDFSAVISFDLQAIRRLPIKRAALSLVSLERQQRDVTLGVFKLVNPIREFDLSAVPARAGIAAQYLDDAGLERDPAVMMVEDFESADWRRRWSEISGDIDVISDEQVSGFTPFAGRALKVRIAEGKRSGASLRFRFGERLGREPEEAYFRYMLRFGDDWRPEPDGGKLPGFAATYGRAGWGGRKSDGTNGWSARGSFSVASSPANPLHHFSAIGSYVYHAETPTRYGDGWPWTDRAPALLANNRWYSVEQQVKLNTPGKNSGVLRAWVDGQLVFERTDLRFRDTPDLRIEEVWVNVFFGGTRPSARTMHLFIDNLVIADRYIGPVRRRQANESGLQQ